MTDPAEPKNAKHDVSAPTGGSTAGKGDWGPADDGGHDVRQLGLITFSDGRQVAVTMAGRRAGEEMGVGTGRLDRVAAWLKKNLGKLPRGRCRSPLPIDPQTLCIN